MTIDISDSCARRSFNLKLSFAFFITFSLIANSHTMAADKDDMTNVSEYMNKKCKVTYSAPVTDKIDIEIISPEYVRCDGEPIRKAYAAVIENINKYHNLNYAPHKIVKWLERHRKPRIRLVLLASAESGHSLKLSSYTPEGAYNNADIHYDMVRVPWDRVGNCTDWLVCKVLFESSRSMWLEMAGVRIKLKTAPLSQPGWYEYGISELISIRSGTSSCYEGSRAMQCYTLFQDPAMRAGLWEFCPGCNTPGKMPGGDELKKALDLVKAAAGAILYFEKTLGVDKFQVLTQEISKDECWQDEHFYKKLSSLAGFDIRKVTQKEIDQIASLVEAQKVE